LIFPVEGNGNSDSGLDAAAFLLLQATVIGFLNEVSLLLPMGSSENPHFRLSNAVSSGGKQREP
jgi:hypothetical protein